MPGVFTLTFLVLVILMGQRDFSKAAPQLYSSLKQQQVPDTSHPIPAAALGGAGRKSQQELLGLPKSSTSDKAGGTARQQHWCDISTA